MIALVTGAGSAVIVALFNTALEWLSARSLTWLPGLQYLLPLAGSLVVGAIFLMRFPESGGEGIPSYLVSVNREGGKLSLAATILKFPATVVTLGTQCSGGIVGPLCRICAGFGSATTALLSRLLALHGAEDVRVAAICGVSGAVSAVFHSPLGGGFFAAEILKKDSIRYGDLFPSILTGGAAYAVSYHLLHQKPVFFVNAPALRMSGALGLWLLLVALVAGMFGLLFIVTFENAAKGLRRLPLGQPARAAAAGIVICGIWLAHARWALGTSMPLYFAVASGEPGSVTAGIFLRNHVTLFLLIAIVVKTVATSLTVGSGMSGGFTGPLVVIGAASGALMSSISGFAMGTPAYYGCIACGIAAILGAVMNIPIAAVLITLRMFGNDYALPAVIGGILAFFLFKSRTIYEYSVNARYR